MIINRTLNFIKNNSNYSEERFNLIEYGLEGIYLTVSKIIIVLAIGIILNYIDIVLLTILFFNILRFFAFGLHAKKSWHCLILSILQFNVIPYLFLHITVSIFIRSSIFILTFISFVLFSPSDTEKRPLTNKSKRIRRKISSIISIIILFIILNIFNYLSVPILCSFIIESLMINPICYKMLGLPYNNYKKTA